MLRLSNFIHSSKLNSNLRAQASQIGQFTSLQDSLHKFEKLHVVHPFYSKNDQKLLPKTSNIPHISNADRYMDTMLLLKNIENLKVVKHSALPVVSESSINDLFSSKKKVSPYIKKFYEEING